MIKKEKISDKRTALLNATLTLVNNHGFHNTPMSKIAKLAGVAPATIYLYFENKQDLVNKLYLEVKKDFSKEFREKVMLASTLGGIQIALAGTSLPHGMGYPLTYFKGLPHGLANGVLTIGYLKSFKDHSKIDKMLSILGFSDLNQLDAAFKKLFTVDIDVTQEEILEYAKSFMNQKEKLKSHTEDVGLEDIIEIYSNSLLK